MAQALVGKDYTVQLTARDTESDNNDPPHQDEECLAPSTSSSTARHRRWTRGWSDRAGLRSPRSLTVKRQLRSIIFRTRWHLMLLLIPAGFGVYYGKARGEVVFAINMAAIIPSVSCLSFALYQLVAHLGDGPAALISSTCNNIGTLVTSILLLRSGSISLTKTSLLGVALCNVLLLPGLCFVVGGIRQREQSFNTSQVKTVSGQLLLAISMISLVTGFRVFGSDDTGVRPSSHAAAVIAVCVYFALLAFEWQTSARRAPRPEPELSLISAICSMVVFTTLLTFNTSFAVDRLPDIQDAITQEFLGLILIPFLSSDPTLLMVAFKNEQDLVLRLTFGKTVQLLLFVLPLLVLIDWNGSVSHVSWSSGMDLNLDGWEIMCLLLSIWVVNYVIQDGRSNWSYGVLIFGLYTFIAAAAWFYPASTPPV